LLPPVLARLSARHPGIEATVTVVREIGPGTAGEVAEGRADLGIATLGTGTPVPSGLVGDVLLEEPYALVHPAGHPDPRSLPLVDWRENCSSCTRRWWAAQDWIPAATVRAEDDGAVLSMVGSGLGMAIMPALSLTAVPAGTEVTDLGPERPTRRVGYVTTPELAATAAVRALVRELRESAKPQVSAV
jgi:DNA-binding transcriptional LysR family regulator